MRKERDDRAGRGWSLRSGSHPPDQYESKGFPGFHSILFRPEGADLNATMPIGREPEWKAADSFSIAAQPGAHP